MIGKQDCFKLRIKLLIKVQNDLLFVVTEVMATCLGRGRKSNQGRAREKVL